MSKAMHDLSIEAFVKQTREDALRDDPDPALFAEAGEVLEGVTPGPWKWSEDFHELRPVWSVGTVQGWGYLDWDNLASREANARFIAWCREGVPALLAQNAALRAERDEALASAFRADQAAKADYAARAEAEAQIAALTARVERLTGVFRRLRKLPDEIEQQVQTTRAYAADCGMSQGQIDLMATCTSHFIDHARTLRAALSATTEDRK